jgi:hypothetical protein
MCLAIGDIEPSGTIHQRDKPFGKQKKQPSYRCGGNPECPGPRRSGLKKITHK